MYFIQLHLLPNLISTTAVAALYIYMSSYLLLIQGFSTARGHRYMCMHMFMYMGIYGRTVHAQQHAYILLGVVHT